MFAPPGYDLVRCAPADDPLLGAEPDPRKGICPMKTLTKSLLALVPALVIAATAALTMGACGDEVAEPDLAMGPDLSVPQADMAKLVDLSPNLDLSKQD